MRADGEDRQVGSRITVDATLGLEPMESNGCMVTIEGQYEVNRQGRDDGGIDDSSES